MTIKHTKRKLPPAHPEIGQPQPKHIVVLTGAGISAESGLATFRDSSGLWQNHSVYEVASLTAWRKDRAKVLAFYNERRQQVRAAKPNAAHYALVELAKHFRVSIITQNVDDLHERAGSENVLHLHGEILKARSSVNSKLIYDLDGKDIQIGDRCERGSQLRPHIVWFGETVTEFMFARKQIESAELLLVIGTSLSVYPAASLINFVLKSIPIYLVTQELENIPSNCLWFRELATKRVPYLIQKLIEKYSTQDYFYTKQPPAKAGGFE
jgi:NAD-dependent deacetylase